MTLAALPPASARKPRGSAGSRRTVLIGRG